MVDGFWRQFEAGRIRALLFPVMSREIIAMASPNLLFMAHNLKRIR